MPHVLLYKELPNYRSSPLTANIYFPAIPTLVLAFDKTTELLNLTVRL